MMKIKLLAIVVVLGWCFGCASGSGQGSSEQWTVDSEQRVRADGLEVEVFPQLGHSSSVNSIAFSSDGRQVLSGSNDRTIKLWDTATGQEIASFISFKDGEWIAVTPDGFYYASLKGDQHLNVRIGNKVYGMNQFAKTFYRPDVVERRLQGLPDPANIRGININTAAIPTEFEVVVGEVDPVTRQVELSITATDWVNQIRNFEIIINGRRIGDSEFQKINAANLIPARARLNAASEDKQFRFTIPLQLEPGGNYIEIIANNDNNFGSEQIYRSTPLSDTVHKGDLWIVAVGVNEHINLINTPDSWYPDLKKPASDAFNIINSFKRQEGKRFDNVYSLQISDNLPGIPPGILPEKKAILSNMEEHLKNVKPHDTVLLFISGHGKTVLDENGNGIYYFLPRDTIFTGGKDFELESAISVMELSDALNLPGRKIVILDTCESGGVDTSRLTFSLRNQSTVIFTAANQDEETLDTELWGGLLAFSVVEGIRMKTAETGTAQIEPLGNHVKEWIKERRGDQQTPVIYFPDWYKNFVIAW